MDMRAGPAGQRVALDDTTDDADIPIGESVRQLLRSWRLLVFGSLLVGVAALGGAFLLPPTHTAVARVLPAANQSGAAALLAQQVGGLAGLAGAAAGVKNPAEQYVSILRSRTVADRLIEAFDLRTVYEAEFIEDARLALAGNTRISAGTRDGIITIEVDDGDRERAAALANGFVSELQSLTRSLALTEASQRRMLFERLLRESKDNLVEAEKSLQASGVNESALKSEPRAAIEEVARLKAALTAAEVRVSTMRGYLAEGSPELRVALQEVSALRAQLARAEQGSGPTATGKGAQYVALYRDFKYHEMLFEMMARQYEIARLDEAREGAVIQVIDQALAPERQSGPKKRLIAIGATLAAFLVLCGLILIRANRARFADVTHGR